jgi:trk system potassium uptake protein TrkH
VLAVPGYLALGLSPVDALFESVSAITSTGLTVATGTMDWPLAGHALRSWMQWAGGFAIAVAGVALILGPGAARATASSLGQTNMPERDILSSTRAQARRLLKVYLAITAISVVVFVPLFPTWWEAVAIALTAVSTGGMTPRPDSLASYTRLAQAATMVACLATAVSLMAYVEARRSGPRVALRQTNAALVLALAIGVAAVAGGLTVALGEGLPAGADAVLNTLSGASTAGFSVAPIGPAPAVMALITGAMLVGGGAGSTAGGLKVERAALLARMVGLTLLRLRAPPGTVATLKLQGDRVPAEHLTALGAVLFLYACSAMVCWVALTAGGIDPMPALFDTVSALSTVGLSLGAAGPDLAWPLKLVLAAAMLLGRLEFLVLIAVLSPGTWAPRLK